MSLLSALAAFNERLEARGDTSGGGYGPAKISSCLELTPDGNPVRFLDLRLADTKGKLRPKEMALPLFPGARTVGIKPFFLWDKTAYSLGVIAQEGESGPEPGQGRRTAEEWAAFQAFHREVLAEAEDKALTAFLAFLQQWRPEQVTQVSGYHPDLLDQNLVFALGRQYLHDTAEAKLIWSTQLAPEGQEQPCLVTGKQGVPARLHPSFKGVLGAQSSGAALVSFNLSAFESYGKSQGLNAPVSQAAAEAYGSALGWLLNREHGRSLRLGDTTLVFWAKEDPKAEAGESLFSALLDPTRADEQAERDLDREDASRIRASLQKIAQGLAVEDAAPQVNKATQIHILGLSPNAARLSVRYWQVDALERLVDCIGAHWQALRLAPLGKDETPAPWMLLDEVALRVGGKPKRETIPPRLAGDLLSAILTGRPYPRTLLSGVIERVRADGLITHRRVAIAKAVLSRMTGEEPIPVSHNSIDDPPAAYRLGRLFALIESAQELALPDLNATVKDRYFAAACATPARVFPLLQKNAMNHLSAARKGDKRKLAFWVESEMRREWNGLPIDLPRSLRLEDQGRFIAGYYHQSHQPKKSEAEAAAELPDPELPNTEDAGA